MTAVRSIGQWLPTDGYGDSRAIEVTIGIRTVSETNQREHHMARHRRRSKQRTTTKLVMLGALRTEGIKWPCHVKLTRVAPSNGLDFDNLVSSMKAVRDGVADALGLDDADPRILWSYEQQRGNRKEFSVIVHVRELRGI
jgi:hypothetical protein